MKKLLTLALIVALALTVVACSQTDNADNAGNADNSEKGTFILGLDASFPPMGFTDADGEIVGFDIDVAQAVCDKLNLELVCQAIDWDSKDMELESGNIDCIWNGFTLTEERKESLCCSIPYMANNQVVIVKNDSGIATLNDLAGKTVALQTGSSAEEALNNNAELKASLGNVILLADNMAALMDLEIGGVDAVIMDEVVARYNITENNKPFAVLDESLAPEEYGIGFRKADTELADSVNNALKELAEDGTLAEISTKWFGSDITIVK